MRGIYQPCVGLCLSISFSQYPEYTYSVYGQAKKMEIELIQKGSIKHISDLKLRFN